MNTLITKCTLAAATALTVIACSPGGVGLAGIGGSGYVSSGSVSGFGSVFVNGVEFETDSATFDVDGVSGTQDDLAIGMVVRVNGTINDDGVTGTATNISFDEELQGPVSSVGTPDADGIKRTLTVLGVNVIVDSSSTTFDIDSDSVPPATIFDFDNIAVNNNVEVSGFYDTNGDIQATRVELKNEIFDTSSIVEVEGTVSELNNNTFKLGNLNVDATAATFDDLPNGLADGQIVEVEGTLDLTLTNITAIKVEGEDNTADDTDEFELEGIITDYVDSSNFKIGDIKIDASNATLEPASLNLADDVHVEVEGAIINGTLIATEIELEGGDIKVHANVTAIDTASNTFEVSPLTGQAITVTVSAGTQFEDDVNEIKLFTLNNLNVTDFVEVRGFDDGSGGISAVEVDIKQQSDVILRGFATAATGTATAGTMTVLGVIFDFDASTDFEDKNDADMLGAQINDLINAIKVTPQLVKIEDKQLGAGGNVVGIADAIDIE
ncbi:MAG: hypothetical protein KAT12_06030 [Gammaproteobacteria bacterium]|nr:hypothetical protein [Gammaproteobacteria bacterium]